jgi:phosphoribosylamine--glycine ligase
MGAYSPAPVVTDEIHQRVMEQVIEPTLAGMAQEGNDYTGFLYAGLMIDEAGQPKVIEYNCRFGDPETQPIMMRLESDLVELCFAALNKTLSSTPIHFTPHAAVGVVMAAGGYPGSYAKGKEIQGIPSETQQQKVFHAGTAIEDGQLVTNGGRVLCVTALGESVTLAQQNAYLGVKQIFWDDLYYRDDIAYRAIEREESN